MSDNYGENIWQWVDYCKYFNWHSTRLDTQYLQIEVISYGSKLRQNVNLTTRNSFMLNKKEIQTVSNDVVLPSLPRIWVSYYNDGHSISRINDTLPIFLFIISKTKRIYMGNKHGYTRCLTSCQTTLDLRS